jgi:hypothetical protein
VRRLILLLALGCNKAGTEGPAAPVTDGGYLVYAVTESSPVGTEHYQLKLSFREQSNRYQITFESTDAEKKAPAVRVDRALVPDDNVITAFDLGRLWLPPEARRSGARTPCGVVSGPRKFQRWEVFAIDGACALAAGTRYYEVSTGMLVGFQFPGGQEITAQLESSG